VLAPLRSTHHLLTTCSVAILREPQSSSLRHSQRITSTKSLNHTDKSYDTQHQCWWRVRTKKNCINIYRDEWRIRDLLLKDTYKKWYESEHTLCYNNTLQNYPWSKCLTKYSNRRINNEVSLSQIKTRNYFNTICVVNRLKYVTFQILSDFYMQPPQISRCSQTTIVFTVQGTTSEYEIEGYYHNTLTGTYPIDMTDWFDKLNTPVTHTQLITDICWLSSELQPQFVTKRSMCTRADTVALCCG
jgi:hypothetical protein